MYSIETLLLSTNIYDDREKIAFGASKIHNKVPTKVLQKLIKLKVIRSKGTL